MAQLFWKSDRPEPGILLALAVAGVLSAAAYVEGRKERACPAFTPDGRPLTRTGRLSGECVYSPLPRPAVLLSPEELRRMARAREALR